MDKYKTTQCYNIDKLNYNIKYYRYHIKSNNQYLIEYIHISYLAKYFYRMDVEYITHYDINCSNYFIVTNNMISYILINKKINDIFINRSKIKNKILLKRNI